MAQEGRVKEVIVDSRINKILAMRTDSVAMLEALDAISEFYTSNTIDARRALRQDLELQNIQLAKKFLSEFDLIRQRIQTVEEQAGKVNNACTSLATRVSEADSNMKSFMEKASELENKRNYYSEQSKEIAQFLSKFQLSSSEVSILGKSNIDDPNEAKAFFDSLRRLKQAYGDCKAMVEKHRYSAGFELLDGLGQHQDMAYQRLFDWVKKKCESLPESGGSEEVDSILQVSIRYLRHLPIYFSQCQDLVINSRRTQLVQRFVVALTQGGPSGRVFRALDLHAHDAVRYVGDMLAWMHQAVASEEEFLQAVFGEDAPNNELEAGAAAEREREAEPRMSSSSSSNQNLFGLGVDEMLARCLQGLGRPLRVRIIQSLESRAGLEVLYTLTDLLSFYEKTFKQIVPKENAVHSTVKGCLLECRRLFVSALSKQSESLLSNPSSYPMDLTASHATKECCHQMQEILRVQLSALSSIPSDKMIGENNDIPNDCYVDTVLGSIIQPLLQSCRLGGQNLSASDMSIFMLNNVSAIQRVLREAEKSNASSNSGINNSNSWLLQLDTEASTWVSVLVREEAGRTLRRSDMDKLLELMEVLPEGIIASGQPGLGQDRVATVLRAFYSSLFSTVAPQFERLHDPDLRETTRRQTADIVAEAHLKVYSIVSSEKNGYNQSVLAHTHNEVRVLLGCS